MLGTIVKGDIKGTVLDQAERAWLADDFAALEKASRGLADICGLKPYLVQPLLLIADKLATRPEYVPAAIHAAHAAAGQISAGSPFADMAVSAWRSHVAKLHMLPDRLAAVDHATRSIYVEQGSPLRAEAPKVWNEHLSAAGFEEQADIAAATLIDRKNPKLNEYAIAALLRSMDQLKNAPRRAQVSFTAALYSQANPDNYQQAVAAWSKHLEAVEDNSMRLTLIRKAAHDTLSDCDLSIHIAAAWEKCVSGIADAEQRVRLALETTYRSFYAHSAKIILASLEALPTPEARTDAAQRAYYRAPNSSDDEHTALIAWQTYQATIEGYEKRLASARKAILSSPGALEQAGIAAILRDADQLARPFDRALAVKFAVDRSALGSPLRTKALASWSKAVAAIDNSLVGFNTAKEFCFSKDCPTAQRLAAALMLRHANGFSDPRQRVNRIVEALQASLGYNPITQRAVKALVVAIPNLEKGSNSIAAAKVAALYASESSSVGCEAINLWREHLNALPRRFERAAAALDAVEAAPQQSAFANSAANEWNLQVTAMDTSAERYEAALKPLCNLRLQPLLTAAIDFVLAHINGATESSIRVKTSCEAAIVAVNPDVKATMAKTWTHHVVTLPETEFIQSVKDATYMIIDSSFFRLEDRLIVLRPMALDTYSAYVAQISDADHRIKFALRGVKEAGKNLVFSAHAMKVWKDETNKLPHPAQRIVAAKEALETGAERSALDVIVTSLKFLDSQAERLETAFFAVEQSLIHDDFHRTQAIPSFIAVLRSVTDAYERLNIAATVAMQNPRLKVFVETMATLIIESVDDVPEVMHRVELLQRAAKIGNGTAVEGNAFRSLQALAEGRSRPTEKTANAFMSKFQPHQT